MADKRYPNQPGHKGPSETGPAAAAAVAPRAITIRQRALAEIERAPATAEEVAVEIGEHWSVVRSRMSELRALGLIQDTGLRGKGALGGNVIIWRITSAVEREVFAARKAQEDREIRAMIA